MKRNRDEPMDFRIAIAGEKDLHGLVEMVLSLWPDCTYGEEYQNYRNILHTGKQRVLIARTDTGLIGFIQLCLRTDYVEGTSSSPVLYVEGIYVEPPHRGCGIGRQLIREAEAWGLENQCREMASDTEPGNTTSIEFHKASGFREVNRIVCFSRELPGR
ncbi:aminoglycoside 6'-N-acetyltransferase [Robiginitalea sp. SC105]|uniref:aminoglycoside 6'-N-acetyltransferase n=1 Tax=Robiginitalea sp. SC105 TaxID=2762332 RepID=UPI001639B322|nr:aminoglycoside 6'-N-acetyltransferase [Robiginitalea sp. SC105]MBC2838581.1 GNAT family N-acetyltransferase [Robiginitalea sp. SC105]